MNIIGAAFLNSPAAYFSSPDTSEAINLGYEEYVAMAEQVIQEWQEEAGLEFAHLLGLLKHQDAQTQERLLRELMGTTDREADREPDGHRKRRRQPVVCAEGAAHYFTCKALSVPPGSILLWALILCQIVACSSRLRVEG